MATESQRELLRTMGLALLDAVPEGWRRVDLFCRMTVDVEDFVLTVLMADGTTADVPIPEVCFSATRDLRRVMYEPDEGTWFSMRFMLDPPAQMHVNFNFFWDPRWRSPLESRNWVRDLEAFPRPDDRIPDWLRAELAGARPQQQENGE
ncbi:hypothetical protein [Saccharomonospora sp. NB11]|uniref:hypothetical protein n=1 Tax=Saccharomonospora sp. NB11 TaxID=1642298 RepID=UPI0027DB8859|nr:hypothetical protein [Saccharomonospora sp. NB11]